MTQPSSSTRLIRKGVLAAETYQIMSAWDETQSIRANFAKVVESNSLGLRNAAWLKEIITTLNSRFQDQMVIEPLYILAKSKLPLREWKWFLLWQLQHTDRLFFRFITEWLFSSYSKGARILNSTQVEPFFRAIISDLHDREVSEYGLKRGSRDLLRMSSDLGLLKGKVLRSFTNTHVPSSAFLWALYDLYGQVPNAYAIVNDPRWRLFLLTPSEVEREMLELHQFQKLHYQTAGSLSQLQLPYKDRMSFIRSITHE